MAGQKKLLAVTTGRADYGLLYPLIMELNRSGRFRTELVATGTHLSPSHGMTIDQIRSDGIDVHHTIFMTESQDSERDICNAISSGITGFSDLYESARPDLVLVLGDRYELWSTCISAVIHKIPIAHLHGGEITQGLIDDPIRHSITKMATFHFTSMDLYADRVIQMGEDPSRVFAVGALGIDNIRNMILMNRAEISEYTGVDFSHGVSLMTYHPVTLDHYSHATHQIKEVLDSIIEVNLPVIITMPNADPAGQVIYKKIQDYVSKYPDKLKLIKNLGQRGYLSAMKYAKLIIGNSSSGILESASFRVPVVNIGDRQGKRFKPRNVIDCTCSKDAILKAIEEAMSDEFAKTLLNLKNPYGDGHAAERIVDILSNIDLTDKSAFLKKGFLDMDYKK
jgi:UDP-hydrolysing UDP-N-acetyl-D-glucosamine 2-epimerase